MTDGIELNGGQSEITEVPSSESENELVESMENPFLDAFDLMETNPSHEALSTWRNAVQLSRNRPRRFQYAPNLSKQAKEQMEISRIALALKMHMIEAKGTWSDQSLASSNQDLYGLLEDTKLSKQKSKGTWSDQSLAMLITVMSLFAGAAYMVLFSFHDAFPISAKFKGVVNLSILELLTFPRTATDEFLVIATVTTTFMLSMGMNTIAVCIFFRKFMRGTFLTILSLFTIVAFSVSFFAMLSKFFPHRITIAGGNLKIPATAIVIFYDIYVIILVCAFAYTVHRWQSSRRKQDAVTEPESKV